MSEQVHRSKHWMYNMGSDTSYQS